MTSCAQIGNCVSSFILNKVFFGASLVDMATASRSQKHASVRIDGLVLTFVIINVKRQILTNDTFRLNYQNMASK